ncbi:MAG: GatB/Yqey family protein [uncultured bacterium]|nr:MAG: GatB/Yqey family protein [uncultured bacterium]OGJ47274.1 MAG: glutamyl-tRNA amidotransferase [Candidatus Peregrinibacteria bacterium RIFOXYA2_FULL_41_18]OGJ48422.1 MAG: glutamyl-tRNA amidotransferase [Candidatus Peregrinibacteria bacterium RIFOXYB12_FULL_41_12]OGJ52886.1 MAG: glutamyl-tRNA amidotransferase [Candidatus Peregrinibacteria bacterium RIFOXYC2_FULL_41_22]OGJ53769.1 MAG: glutamyl-tRNA amidotransferase [Candidatus Peregrinibacteria bacterium RIFOXYB2_FULL_41_88]
MALKEKITADLKEAMLAHDEIRVSTLRMLKAAVMKFEVSGTEKKEATDDDVMSMIKKEVKSRKDSYDQFMAGNREDLAKKEQAEMKILEVYMPEQMSEEQVREIAIQVIAQVGATSMADIGKVMGALMGKVKGKADGGLVNKVVKELLQK